MKSKKLKVAVFTGSRAEYGLLFWLMRDIDADKDMKLYVIASGMHLSHEFGDTYSKIEEDGFKIDEKVEILLSSNTPIGILKSMGLGLIGYSESFTRIKPDLIIILGDRFEALAAAQSAMLLRIPILHLHGGEITEGAYDDSIRHAITKLSYLHATSTEEYRKRVIQLGESPNRVKYVGAIGLDAIKKMKFLNRKELTKSLNFDCNCPYFLITFHPTTLDSRNDSVAFSNLLSALDSFKEFNLIFTYPNADDGGRKIIERIKDYSIKNSDRAFSVPSMGQLNYLSALKHASLVIGNSSSGIIEAPSFKIPSVNIGVRQKGRLSARSVYHSSIHLKDIKNAINSSLKLDQNSKNFKNPYELNNTSRNIINMIKKSDLKSSKSFYSISNLD